MLLWPMELQSKAEGHWLFVAKVIAFENNKQQQDGNPFIGLFDRSVVQSYGKAYKRKPVNVLQERHQSCFNSMVDRMKCGSTPERQDE